MVNVRRDSSGNYKARKSIPDDVREEYGRLYGPRFEAKFFASSDARPDEAKRRFDGFTLPMIEVSAQAGDETPE